MTLKKLAAKVQDKTAIVGVVGLGYVGLPLARVFCDAGFTVLGFDLDEKKMLAIAEGKNYLKHLGDDFVSAMTSTGRFTATQDFERLSEPDALLVCVPTPLGPHLEPDLSYVEVTTEDIARRLRPGQLVVLESTTYPSTTREVMLPRLEATGLKHSEDFYLAYSPEREDPGRQSHSTQQIPKLIGGIDEASGKLAFNLYRSGFDETHYVSSAEVAEAAKLLENIYRAVNIALVNEMKVVLTEMNIDVWEVIEAASTKPFGFQAFYPGPGLGGHCIPIDPFYLTWKAQEVGMPTHFIELAGRINRGMPDYVVQRTMLALNDKGKALKNARVLVLGLAYKPDVDDVRESPAFELIERLKKLGALVDYNDPHVPETFPTREYNLQMSSVALTEASLASYDCVLVATHHKAYNWQFIADHAQLIVDARGALRGVKGAQDHIVQA